MALAQAEFMASQVSQLSRLVANAPPSLPDSPADLTAVSLCSHVLGFTLPHEGHLPPHPLQLLLLVGFFKTV